MSAQIAVAILGIWLMVSPSVLSLHGISEDLNYIIGPAASSFAIIAWWEATRNVRIINIYIGIFLIIVPFIFGYKFTALINSIITGIVISVLSLYKGRITGSFGGGWKSLFNNN